MTAVAWVDASAGASGDMLLGALLDAGASLEAVTDAVTAIGVEPIGISTEPVHRRGLRALRAHVVVAGAPPDAGAADAGTSGAGVADAGTSGAGRSDETGPKAHALPHRTWADVRELLASAAGLPDPVRTSALAVFAALAAAEAHVHGTDVDSVHFHEVGALDAIADVVGVCAAVHDLGIAQLTCSPVAVGSGTVRTAHGLLPVPVPAVVELLRRAGLPSHGRPGSRRDTDRTSDSDGASDTGGHEACTPTGAALLAVLATEAGPQPPMTVTAVGIGAGARDPDDGPPNVVRVLLGDPTPPPAECAVVVATRRRTTATTAHSAQEEVAKEEVVLETNVDDLDPRLWPGVLAALLDAGAADAWLTPVLMKKGRPAHTLHVLCDDAMLHDVRHVVVTYTSAIGFREHRVVKHALERRMTSVEVRGQPVRVKVSSYDGAIVTAQPEFDDVAAVAAALGLPPRVLLAEAVVAAEMVRTAGDLDVPATAADTDAAPHIDAAPHTDAATDVATGADR